MLAQAQQADIAMAPAADMFEMGVKVQVLKRGTLFAMRAAKLYELYRAHDGLDADPRRASGPTSRRRSSARRSRRSGSRRRTTSEQRDPARIERAEREPKQKMALVFRWYLGMSSHWANSGEPSRTVDYQIWCGPAMAAFNDWVRGSFLEPPENRRVADVAINILYGAAVLDPRPDRERARGSACRAACRDWRRWNSARLRTGCSYPNIPRIHRELPAPSTTRTACDRPLTTSRKGRDLNSSDLSPPVPVAIIGMGCMFPQAENLARYWANIRKGVDAITEVPETHWRSEDYFDDDPKAADRTYARRGGFLDAGRFPAARLRDRPQYRRGDRHHPAPRPAGRPRRPSRTPATATAATLDRDRVSVILGVTGTLELVIPLGARLGHPIWRRALKAAGVDRATTEDVVRRIADSYVGWQENSFPGLLGNVAAGRIANRLDLRGTNCVVDAACASSLGAVNLAMLELAAGRCDLAVTGGLDTFNDIFMYMCFSKTPALSPTGDARPFDAEADGTILGEGLGVLVLKRLDDARRDGDRVYAVIRSIGTSSDGKGQAVYAPSAAGQVEALRAGVSSWPGSRPATVELVEAHGTGTKVGDATELAALERGLPRRRGPGAPGVRLGSVKSQVGPHEGRRGRGRADQGRAGASSQGLAADDQGPPADRARWPGRFAVLPEHRGAALAAARATTRGARPSAPSASAAATFTACSRRPSPTSRASTGTATCRSSPSRPMIAAEIAARARRAWTA